MPVETSTANTTDFESIIPTDMALMRAVNIDLSGEVLTASAELSIPLPDGFNSSNPVIVARLFEADGKRLLEIVATANVTGGLITSQTTDVAGLALPGIVKSGTYLFIETVRAVGFIRGTVSGLDGAVKEGALVRVAASTIADISNVGGTYIVAALSGPWSASAINRTTRNRGSASGTLSTNNEVQTHNINITSTPPVVVSISPTNGATGADDKGQIVVTFSEPISKGSATDGAITLTNA
ncbi:MAG: Ig-like domain-containing protein, partial [Deltaproteobacteria bacterium]|nr:Ig-like domain-containing protein [Deltaproteobacteria bacterium]